MQLHSLNDILHSILNVFLFDSCEEDAFWWSPIVYAYKVIKYLRVCWSLEFDFLFIVVDSVNKTVLIERITSFFFKVELS